MPSLERLCLALANPGKTYIANGLLLKVGNCLGVFNIINIINVDNRQRAHLVEYYGTPVNWDQCMQDSRNTVEKHVLDY